MTKNHYRLKYILAHFRVFFMFIVRIILSIVGLIVLPIPTLYATAKNLDRLPWGLDPVFGCREDGWNGTGCDPEHKRKHWKNVDGETVQGWWPDFLGVIWDELPFIKKWWYGFQWCALRNRQWNIRLLPFLSTSIHYQDIKILKMEIGEGESRSRTLKVIWRNLLDDKIYYFKRSKAPFIWDYFESGYEFYLEYFEPSHSWYDRVRKQGYTFDVAPFKNRSIVSIRPRNKR